MKNRFLLLDAARCGQENIDAAASFYAEKPGIAFPLAGNEAYMESVAPHLFPAGNELMQWYGLTGWGDSWGIVVEAGASFETCLLHFQRIAIQKDARGSRYFRFYDPRVLSSYLPVCDQKKLADFFGPIDKFIAETENQEEAVEYRLQNGMLATTKIAVNNLFGTSAAVGA